MALAALAKIQEEQIDEIVFRPVPTIESFHMHPGQIRGIVGPVGSGKTSGTTWEVCRYLSAILTLLHSHK